MKAISLENVGKKFMLPHHRDGAVKGFFYSFPGQKVATEFWALREINMEVQKGKVVGVIGRNGAGKSTLLNILAGTASPSVGKVDIDGSVSCLLTLGAGFQDELSGRENIYLNSSILGMSRNEINKKYRNIVEFSELDGFLDSPIQTYSQGMRLRLGFSIAVHTDFDILLIDEILSVGDVCFQKKSFDKIEEFRRQGKTMIVVTQNLDIVERFCDEVCLLENGKLVQYGHPQQVTAHYLKLLNEKKLADTFHQRFGKLRWWANKMFWEKTEGSKEIRITDVKTYNARGKYTNRFNPREKVTVKVHFIVLQEVIEPHFGISIFRDDGVYCYGPNTSFDGHMIHKLNKGQGFFSIEYQSLILKPGKYRFSVAVWDKNELWAYDYHVGFYRFEIIGENKNVQLSDLGYVWEKYPWWEKIKMPRLEKLDSFYNLAPIRKKDVVSPDIKLTSIEFLDPLGNAAAVFRTGEDLKIKFQFKFLRGLRKHYFWVGLFRSDGVYCHSVWRMLRKEKLILVYPKAPLLTGDYYLSVGVWKKNKREPLLYKDKAFVFEMSFLNGDHGTVYLEHLWDLKLP